MKSELNFKEIGVRIQKYRTQNKMTQEDLAEIIGTDQKYISRIEGGYHRSNLDTIVVIARALHVSVDMLIADFSDSTNESTLKVIMDEIRGMSPKQLEMLKDNIATIKKFDK